MHINFPPSTLANLAGTAYPAQQYGGNQAQFDLSDIIDGDTMAMRGAQTVGHESQFDPGDILAGETMAAQASQTGSGLDQPGSSQQLAELLNMLTSLFSTLLNGGEPLSEGSSADGIGDVSGGGASPQQAAYGNESAIAAPEVAQPGGTSMSANAGTGLSDATAKSTPGLAQWNKEIATASAISGLDPNKIGAHIWAESRGRADTITTNVDGTKDRGLIQIGQERWNRDVVPKLSAQEKADIRKATGKDAAALDVSNPRDNLIAGSLHIKQSIEFKGGNIDAGTKYYNDGDVTGTGDIYLKRVNYYEQLLKSGKPLSMEDPF